MRPFTNNSLGQNSAKSPLIGGVGGATTSYIAGIQNIVVHEPRKDLDEFYGLITDYHIIEVKNPLYDSGDSSEEYIDELFYIWHQVDLIKVNKEMVEEPGDRFYESVEGTRYKIIKTEQGIEGKLETSGDHVGLINNLLLDTHGCIPKNSLVLIKNTNDTYIWDTANQTDFEVPVYRTVWQGVINCELKEDLHGGVQTVQAFLIDEYRERLPRLLKINNELGGFNGFGYIAEEGEEGETDYEEEKRGSYAQVYVSGHNNFHIINIENQPVQIYGWVAHEFDEDDNYLYIYLGGSGDAPPVRIVSPHNSFLMDEMIKRYVIDEVILNEGESDEVILNDVIKVRNIFRYFANENAIAYADLSYDRRDLEEDAWYILTQVQCKGFEEEYTPE